MFTKIGKIWVNLSAVVAFDFREDDKSELWLLGGKVLLLNPEETKALIKKFDEFDRAQSAARLGLN